MTSAADRDDEADIRSFAAACVSSSAQVLCICVLDMSEVRYANNIHRS